MASSTGGGAKRLRDERSEPRMDRGRMHLQHRERRHCCGWQDHIHFHPRPSPADSRGIPCRSANTLSSNFRRPHIYCVSSPRHCLRSALSGSLSRAFLEKAFTHVIAAGRSPGASRKSRHVVHRPLPGLPCKHLPSSLLVRRVPPSRSPPLACLHTHRSPRLHRPRNTPRRAPRSSPAWNVPLRGREKIPPV